GTGLSAGDLRAGPGVLGILRSGLKALSPDSVIDAVAAFSLPKALQIFFKVFGKVISKGHNHQTNRNQNRQDDNL
ncbi:MAG TPA: hypothetical protein VIR02_21675, partial [Anaerolineales bacterium]